MRAEHAPRSPVSRVEDGGPAPAGIRSREWEGYLTALPDTPRHPSAAVDVTEAEVTA
jgi:hypothetical protein